ncbi:hypothetical protein VRY54_10115 [Actinomyces sp. F1_1611]
MGDWRDSVFALVMVINAAIGVFSELRSKRVLDSVAVLAAPTSQVLRAGKVQTVNNDDLVVDDLVELRLGDQIPADGTVLSTRGLEVDESILTGESLPVWERLTTSSSRGQRWWPVRAGCGCARWGPTPGPKRSPLKRASTPS